MLLSKLMVYQHISKSDPLLHSKSQSKSNAQGWFNINPMVVQCYIVTWDGYKVIQISTRKFKMLYNYIKDKASVVMIRNKFNCTYNMVESKI